MTRPTGPDFGQLFPRLERAAVLIARHPAYPGKEEAVRLCREDIEDHESLTTEQRIRLLAILGDEAG